uniref:Uncharacterized protein n=1 Tax=Caenorhabditis japonica TaxID=281687 RepID=A0A8R1DG99_CAEJA
MIPSTSTNIPITDQVPEVTIQSDYEDAVSSGEELAKLCTSLKSHLQTSSNDRKQRNLTKILSNRERMAQYQRERESSKPGEMRSRRGTNLTKRRSNSGSDRSSDWRVLNLAFQEMAHYPLLMQLNEQLMEISRQLNNVEATNTLQLKVIMHLLKRVSKRRTTWTQTIWQFLRSFQFFIFAFSWPFIARLLYMWYLRMIRA